VEAERSASNRRIGWAIFFGVILVIVAVNHTPSSTPAPTSTPAYAPSPSPEMAATPAYAASPAPAPTPVTEPPAPTYATPYVPPEPAPAAVQQRGPIPPIWVPVTPRGAVWAGPTVGPMAPIAPHGPRPSRRAPMTDRDHGGRD
jgi:hypothetical protein